jgi:hypothetical protein
MYTTKITLGNGAYGYLSLDLCTDSTYLTLCTDSADFLLESVSMGIVSLFDLYPPPTILD